MIFLLYGCSNPVQNPKIHSSSTSTQNFLLLPLNQPSNRHYKPTAQLEKSGRKGRNCKRIQWENASRAENCSVTLWCPLPWPLSSDFSTSLPSLDILTCSVNTQNQICKCRTENKGLPGNKKSPAGTNHHCLTEATLCWWMSQFYISTPAFKWPWDPTAIFLISTHFIAIISLSSPLKKIKIKKAKEKKNK